MIKIIELTKRKILITIMKKYPKRYLWLSSTQSVKRQIIVVNVATINSLNFSWVLHMFRSKASKYPIIIRVAKLRIQFKTI